MSDIPASILFFGRDDHFGLCPSYLRSAEALGHRYELFNYEKEFNKHVRFGKWGRRFAHYFPVENWIQKMNRAFIIKAMQMKPDIIIVVTNAPVRTAALLFLRSVLPDTRFVLLWPDSLANFHPHVFPSAGLYDFIASYGSTALPYLESAGFKKAVFVPLAGDPRLHHQDIGDQFDYDLTFVGGWRPERETALAHIARQFPQLKLKVFGPQWEKSCSDPELKKHCVNQPLYGQDMARVFQRSRINMNIIDDTNYPSANMRFFEIPTAGGLQITSSCPEMEQVFKHREHLLYFKDTSDLSVQIEWALQNPEALKAIRQRAQQLIHQQHNYDQRLQTILAAATI